MFSDSIVHHLRFHIRDGGVTLYYLHDQCRLEHHLETAKTRTHLADKEDKLLHFSLCSNELLSCKTWIELH